MFEHRLGKADVTKARGLGLGFLGEEVLEGFLNRLLFGPIAPLIKQAPGEGNERIANGRIGLTAREIGGDGNACKGCFGSLGFGFGVLA